MNLFDDSKCFKEMIVLNELNVIKCLVRTSNFLLKQCLTLLENTLIEVCKLQDSCLLVEAKTKQDSFSTLYFANSCLECFVFEINLLEFRVIWIFQDIADVDVYCLEACLCYTWLSIFCVECFDRLDSVLDLLHRSFFGFLLLLLKEFGLVEWNAESLALIPLQLDQHLLLSIHKLLLILLSLSKCLLFILLCLKPLGCRHRLVILYSI